jgi:hypothetical protein
LPDRKPKGDNVLDHVNEEMMGRMYKAHQHGNCYQKIQNKWTLPHDNEYIRTDLKYTKRKKEKAAQGKTLFKGSYMNKVQKIKEFT